MLDQHRCDACRHRKSDLEDILAMPTTRRGIIAFIAKVATMNAAPMKPKISKYFMARDTFSHLAYEFVDGEIDLSDALLLLRCPAAPTKKLIRL
jgi:hypothetical protein